MKAINKIWVFALGTAVMVSCSDLDTFPESGIVTEDQKKEVVEDNPERLQADINTLSSIFTKLLPNWAGGSATPFHNDFSYNVEGTPSRCHSLGYRNARNGWL